MDKNKKNDKDRERYPYAEEQSHFYVDVLNLTHQLYYLTKVMGGTAGMKRPYFLKILY